MIESYLKNDLVEICQNELTREELFSRVFTTLLEKNYVEETYLEALNLREDSYPTGLVTPTYNAAIPHTDPEFIKEQFIYIVKLEKPVIFDEMGQEGKKVDVDFVFFLGFNKGEEQLVLLQQLMKLFNDKSAMEELAKANNTEKVFNCINDFFNND